MTALKCLWHAAKALPSGHTLAFCLNSSVLEQDVVDSLSCFSGILKLKTIDFCMVQT